MTIFTKDKRQQIVDAFIEKHGSFDARAFIKEVRLSNGTHPAWAWFEWNDGRAADEYRVVQARQFVQGLKVKFEVVTVESTVVVKAPSVVSPLEHRHVGGYKAFNPETDMDELRRQAVQGLQTWMRRYEAAIVSSGLAMVDLESIVEKISPPVLTIAAA